MKLRIAHTSLLKKLVSKTTSNKDKCIKILFSCFFTFQLLSASSQVSITNFATPYTTNFNTLGNVQTATLPSGFVSGGSWSAGVLQTNQMGGSAGTVSVLTSTSPSGLYNFGTGQNDTATDRALGFIYSTAYRNPHSIVYAFTNNTGADIRQIALTWDYKKFRTGAAAHFWNFYHGSTTNTVNTTTSAAAALNATSITVASAVGIVAGMSVTITSGTGTLSANTVVQSVGVPTATTVILSQPVTTAIPSGSSVSFNLTATSLADSTGYIADANSTTINAIPTVVSKSINLNSVTIPNGSTYYLRWMMGANTGACPAMGLDNLSITFGDGRCYPYTQARIDSITIAAAGSLNVNYTRGNGNSVMIVASTSNTPTAPTNGTAYTANTTYGSGTALGSGFVVYNGTGNGVNTAHTVNVTNLLSSTPYYFYAYEYNTAGNCYHPTVVSGNGSFSGATDYFRSRASGNWNTAATWESSKDNVNWITSTIKPDSTAKAITIRTPDSVAIAAAETAKNLTISLGATLSYNTAAATGGAAFAIGNDPANEFDFNIYGRYIIFGTPATLATGAKVKIFNNGLIRADNNAGGLSDNFAFNQNVYFTNGSVFEWNNTNSLNSSNSVYFNYLGSQPIADVPTFRFTKAPSTPVGASAATRVNGITEINAPTGQLQFQSAGIKYFRNGVTGTGTLLQASTCGQFVISGPSFLGGTGPINLSTAGLKIADTAVTTILSSKPINGSTTQLDGTLYTSTNAITGTTAFTASAIAKLYIGSPNGITASAASGNIQSTGTRTYNSAATYHYYGTASQVTGDGLPLTLTGSLNISNTGGAGNNVVTLTNSGTTTSLFNLNSGLFASGTSGVLNIAASGTINGNGGNVTNSTDGGIINFNGSGTVSGTASAVSFYKVTTSGAVNFGTTIASTINNLFQINAGGSVNTNPPIYANGSILQYNTGGTFARSTEFSTTSGKGYPYHVQISNNTLLDMGSTTPAVYRQMAGNLTVDAGSTFSLNNGTNDMTAAVSVKGNLELNGTLTLSDLAGGDLQLGGNWNRTATGVFNANDRSVYFNGNLNSTTITAVGGQYFPSVYLTKAAKINSVRLLDSVAIGKELQIVTGTLDLANKDLVLLSNINTTASIGKINSVTAEIAYTGTGRFIVERYIRTGTTNLATGQHGKTWQHLAIPTRESVIASGQTIQQAWQEGAASPNANPMPGYGTQIVGYGTSSQLATAITNGFDTVSIGGATIKKYNSATGLWDYVSNTRNTAIYDKRGYMIFVRGDRSVTQYSSTNNATPTILRSRGKLLSPTMPPDTVVVPAGKMVSIGNPYASAIDFTLFNFSLNDSQIYSADSLKYWFWDPTLTGSYGLGGYQALSGVNDYYLTAPGGTGSASYTVGQRYTRIESGQAFLMKSYSNADFRFEINEDAKVSDSRNVFRATTGVSSNPAKQFLRMYLYAGAGEGAVMADGVSAVFSSNYSNRFDGFDMEKMSNTGENLSIRCGGKSLSVEARSLVVRTDSVYLTTTNLRPRTYELRFAPQQIPATGIEMSLFDKYLNSLTPLSTGDSSYYSFVVNADPSSYRSDRFTVVFKNTQRVINTQPKTLIQTAKNLQETDATTASQWLILSNPVSDGVIHLQSSQMVPGKYAYSIIGINGQTIQTGELNIQNKVEFQSIKLKNIVQGQYQLVITGKNGKEKQTLSVLVGL